MRRQKSEFDEIDFMLPKASQYKPVESPVSGQKLWFHNLLAKSFPQNDSSRSQSLHHWNKDFRSQNKRFHRWSFWFLSPFHEAEHSCTHPVTISAQLRFASAASMEVHLPWLCLLVGAQPVCAETNLGWEGSCQPEASKEATQQAETTKGELSQSLFSSAFLIPHVVCP